MVSAEENIRQMGHIHIKEYDGIEYKMYRGKMKKYPARNNRLIGTKKLYRDDKIYRMAFTELV